MKAYYFLNDISYANYYYFIDKLKLLRSWKTCDQIINEYFYKIWENNNWRINFWFFLDAICFIDVIKDKYGITYDEVLNNIEWVHYNKNFYIYNEAIYESTIDWKYNKISLKEDVYFATSRDIWLNPFFLLLYKLSEINKNLFVIRPNKREWWIYNDDKISNISKLYLDRKNLVWDVLVPFILKTDINSIIKFIKEVKNRLWNYAVIKKNSSEFWNGVKMLNLSNYKTEESCDYLKIKFLNNRINSTSSVYLVPFYKIKEEYRVYYFYDKINWVTTVSSIKNRKNTNIWDVFSKANFTIDENVSVEWSLFDKNLFISKKKYFNFVDSIVKNLWYDRWVIEFIETDDGKLIFGEINTLWAVLMFPEDEYNMISHWKMVWKSQIN